MRLNHATLPAHDISASIAFYEALGLELIVKAETRYARFTVDEVSTLSVEVTDAGRAGTTEIFFCCANVDDDYTRAVARNLVFDWPPTDQTYNWRTAGISDPAGNRVILFTAGTNQHFPPWRLDGRKAPEHEI